MAGFFLPGRALGGGTRAAPYTASMLWIKAFHIVFVASWFAGLFYLPRIFVNLAMVPPASVAERERLLLMSRKLYRFTGILAVPSGDTRDDQQRINAGAVELALTDAEGPATVEASTVVYAADGTVEAVPVIARLDDGRRVSAQCADDRASLAATSLVGARISVSGTPPAFHVDKLAASSAR